MSDIAGELRVAAGSPRRDLDLEATLRRGEQLGRRARRARVGFALSLVVLALAVAGLVLPQRDSDPLAGTEVLPLPELGAALDTYLDDGTPVWVTRTTDDEVHVLLAQSEGMHVWGRHTFTRFEPFLESPWGSWFAADGTAVYGPAAAGLGRFETVEVGPDSVRVDLTVDPIPAPRNHGWSHPWPGVSVCREDMAIFPHAEWADGFEEWFDDWYGDDYFRC